MQVHEPLAIDDCLRFWIVKQVRENPRNVDRVLDVVLIPGLFPGKVLEYRSLVKIVDERVASILLGECVHSLPLELGVLSLPVCGEP